MREGPNVYQLPTSQWAHSNGGCALPTSATCPGGGTGGPDTRPLWQAHTLRQPCPPPATPFIFTDHTLLARVSSLTSSPTDARKPSPPGLESPEKAHRGALILCLRFDCTLRRLGVGVRRQEVPGSLFFVAKQLLGNCTTFPETFFHLIPTQVGIASLRSLGI